MIDDEEAWDIGRVTRAVMVYLNILVSHIRDKPFDSSPQRSIIVSSECKGPEQYVCKSFDRDFSAMGIDLESCWQN